MIDNKDIPEELQEYYFHLPEQFIAKYPVIPRDHAKLMILNNKHIQHDYFYNLDKYILPNSIVVFNNTKVSFRRTYLYHQKTHKKFEVVFLEISKNNIWKCLIRNGRKLKKKDILYIDIYKFILEYREDKFFYLSAWKDQTPVMDNNLESEEFFNQFGEPPIPPYLKRNAENLDKEYYQTIFAKNPGSVAAPTASLHFTDTLIEKIKKKSKIVFLNLQVSYGTFSPLTEKELKKNELFEEIYEIPEETAQLLNQNYKKLPIIAVGTTTLRALEDNLRKFNHFKSGSFFTKIFLKPPDKILSCNYLITNFHLPCSSLFMLACAFGGTENLKYAYNEAIKNKYRFYSYGDGMMLKNIYF